MIKTLISIFCVSFSNLIAHFAISLEEYAQMIGNVDPTTQRIRTLNSNGSAMCFTTELTEAFLEHCQDPKCTYVLEVGCAYGIKASQIVQTGVFLVANDIDSRHLEIMQQIFAQLSETHPYFNNVRYVAGNFAALGEEQIGSKKFDAILCESVLHFMRPEELRKALNILHTSLNHGGKIYITVLSSYWSLYRESFDINKANGIEWPGSFEDPDPVRNIHYNLFDEDILLRELKYAGFRVLQSKYIQNPFLPRKDQYNGRDWVIAIAEKE